MPEHLRSNTIRPHSSLGYRSAAPEAWVVSAWVCRSRNRYALPLLHTPDRNDQSKKWPRYTNNETGTKYRAGHGVNRESRLDRRILDDFLVLTRPVGLVDWPRPGEKLMGGCTETKIFDPKESKDGTEVLDATVAYRGDQWWMYLAGQTGGYGATHLFSASLTPGSALSASGWCLTRDEGGRLIPLCDNWRSIAWDGGGGRHCPSYVRGWDPHKKSWVERLYYAGVAENIWGPYTIGYLEWDGASWQDRTSPAFVANEDWEHGSVYEPNLIYHDGKWKMWYVAGSNQENYFIHGYAESQDGQSGWSKHVILLRQR